MDSFLRQASVADQEPAWPSAQQFYQVRQNMQTSGAIGGLAYTVSAPQQASVSYLASAMG